MFSSSIKKNPKCRGFRFTSACSENNVLQLVRCVFSSLLVGIRVNFTNIKVVMDKTGCHRSACNVSWAWFLLWAGSAALHFYSNLPKTIPCVIWLRNLSDAENIHVGGTDVCEPGPLQRILYSGTPGHYQLYITTAGVGWAHQRGHQRVPLPGWCVIKMGWASVPQLRQVRDRSNCCGS